MYGVLTEIMPTGRTNMEVVRFEGCPEKYGRFEVMRNCFETDEIMRQFEYEMRRRYRVFSPCLPLVSPDKKPSIKKVIFNDPATIVIWSDDSKTVVKCQPGDTYSEELGLAMCISKKYLGNKGNFNEEFKKWIQEDIKKDPYVGSCNKCRFKSKFSFEKPCSDCNHNGGKKNCYKEV